MAAEPRTREAAAQALSLRLPRFPHPRLRRCALGVPAPPPQCQRAGVTAPPQDPRPPSQEAASQRFTAGAPTDTGKPPDTPPQGSLTPQGRAKPPGNPRLRGRRPQPEGLRRAPPCRLPRLPPPGQSLLPGAQAPRGQTPPPLLLSPILGGGGEERGDVQRGVPAPLLKGAPGPTRGARPHPRLPTLFPEASAQVQPPGPRAAASPSRQTGHLSTGPRSGLASFPQGYFRGTSRPAPALPSFSHQGTSGTPVVTRKPTATSGRGRSGANFRPRADRVGARQPKVPPPAGPGLLSRHGGAAGIAADADRSRACGALHRPAGVLRGAAGEDPPQRKVLHPVGRGRQAGHSGAVGAPRRGDFRHPGSGRQSDGQGHHLVRVLHALPGPQQQLRPQALQRRSQSHPRVPAVLPVWGRAAELTARDPLPAGRPVSEELNSGLWGLQTILLLIKKNNHVLLNGVSRALGPPP